MQCYDASLGALRRWRANYFSEQGKPFPYMALLTVVPEVQRKGVGSALLREGLKEVDRKGLPAFIEASPAGLGLYKKFGWEEMVESTVNLRDHGGEDVECVTVGLVRPAGAKETCKKQPDA
jgi:predicted N-acetyltransferase YhbS